MCRYAPNQQKNAVHYPVKGLYCKSKGGIRLKKIRILYVLLIVLFLSGCTREKAVPSASPETTADRRGEVVITAPPGSTPSIIAPSPSPSFGPAEFYGLIDASGSVRTDTGTRLNLVADWSCVSVNSGKAKLTITLSLESYSLFVGERPYNTLTINGNTITFHTPSIESECNDTISTPIYTWTETLPLSEDGKLSLDIAAEWFFAGVYSGVELDSLRLETRIELP